MHGDGALLFNLTAHPTAKWTAQRLVEAFPFDTASNFHLRDDESIYGAAVQRRINGLGVKNLVATPASFLENVYAERVIDPIRRECLDHTIMLNERHLRRVLNEYLIYYQDCRTHLGLSKDAQNSRALEPHEQGNMVTFPLLAGRHHRYVRVAVQ